MNEHADQELLLKLKSGFVGVCGTCADCHV